jgi:hypothetical protein
MSTGGVFQIITNDGKQDRMLMATALLHDRLDKIWRAKKAVNPGMADDDVRVLPSLLDIEKTHILFTNAHFKPFAAIGFEYNKVRPTAGNTSLGSNIQFSIPQFGDFFHDIAFHCVLSQPQITVNAGTTDQNKPAMRWCNFPGERLLSKVQQEVNGNPLDEYTVHATVAHREYRVAPNKLTAWKRCTGQEEPEMGSVVQPNWVGSNRNPDSHQVLSQVSVGAQTPSGQKTGSLELFVPLLFWYNKDVRLAVPSVAIPYGQRFINITLARRDELVDLVPRGTGTWTSPNGTMGDVTLSQVELYINNIFVNPEVHKIYIKRVGFSLIRVHRQQLFTITPQTASSELHLQQLKWPIEYLFVGAKVRDYFDASDPAYKRQNLDVWDKYTYYADQTYRTTGQNCLRDSALTDGGVTTGGVAAGGKQLGVATTGALTTVAAPNDAVLASLPAVGDLIQIAGVTYTVSATTAAAVGDPVTTVTVTPAPAVAVANSIANSNGARLLSVRGTEVSTKRHAPTLDVLSISAHSIDLYKEFPSAFFNAYTTYHYGGPNVNAPQDVGSLFIPFCLYPGTYQPSGHINVSRAREFYLKFTSSFFSGSSAPNGAGSRTGLLVVIASAINFLLISDGSAVLRYST